MENQVQKSVPNAMLIMICGIVSIVFCCGLGTVAGVIALIMSSKAKKLISQDPEGYSDAKNVKIGRTCAMIGLGLQLLAVLFYIIYIVFLGAMLGMM